MSENFWNAHLSRRKFLHWGAVISGAALAFARPSQIMAAGIEHVPVIPVPSHKPRAPRVLVIDPGHGGHDPGAIGLSGVHEKDVTLDIARHMAEVLGNQPGIRVALTRNEDVFLPLQERVRIGRQAQADMFVSIHADSAPNSNARGLSAYTLSEHASDQFAKDLADHENEADLMGGVDVPVADKDVSTILRDLVVRRTHNMAQHARSDFIETMQRSWHLLDHPMRSANFVVLRAPEIPSMLVETGFLSNAQDEQVLRQPLQRQKIAEAMAMNLANILNAAWFG